MRPIRDSFLVATEGEKPFFTDLMKTRQIDNPYYQDYNPVIDLSKKILQHKGLSFGSSSNSSAFLFDISMLFEYFIRKLLLKNGINLISKNDDLRIPTGSERYIRKLIPDIVTEDKDGLSVFDVKYKNFDPIYGVKREDLFQIHTYIGQIGNKFKVKKAGFIYPYKGDKNIINQQKMNLMGKEIEFYLIRIAVPTSQDSEDFKAIFKNNCDDFIEFFKNKN
jgi:5-methylcytosine-specific restriction endonuclease McrBC regulatory subunit McrC